MSDVVGTDEQWDAVQKALDTRTPPAADAEQAWREAYRACHDTLFCHESKAAAAVIQAYGDARAREALERAAMLAEELTDYATITPFVHRERVITAIRALKENPNG